MNIKAVNNIQTYKSNTSFKGLWGKATSTPSDFDSVLNIPKIDNSYYYYPFADETEDEIQKEAVIEGAEVDYSESSPRYVVHDFKLCTTLPITKKDYEEYIQISCVKGLPEDTMIALHKINEQVADKYLDSGYKSYQTTAINLNLAEKLLDYDI